MDHLSQVSEDFAKLGASVLESLDVSGLSRKTRGLEFKHLMYGTKLRLHYRDKYESAKAIFKTLYSMTHAFLTLLAFLARSKLPASQLYPSESGDFIVAVVASLTLFRDTLQGRGRPGLVHDRDINYLFYPTVVSFTP